MIPPNTDLKPEDRISLPVQLVNEIFALLQELPAKTSMALIIAIQEQAETIEEV